MAHVLGMIREQGALSIIDCKRGDVTGTMEGYAEAMLGEQSGFGGDAMTVTAYLGFGALKPVFDRAAKCDAAVFVVVRSSNAEGRTLQDARLADGRTVADALADDITAFNDGIGNGIGPIGALIGATTGKIGATTLGRLPRSLILAPGVGAQGASLDDVRRNFGPAIGRTLPSVSRAILRFKLPRIDCKPVLRRPRDHRVFRQLAHPPNGMPTSILKCLIGASIDSAFRASDPKNLGKKEHFHETDGQVLLCCCDGWLLFSAVLRTNEK
jgi:orotidine-5'-phosphate decarboxylase